MNFLLTVTALIDDVKHNINLCVSSLECIGVCVFASKIATDGDFSAGYLRRTEYNRIQAPKFAESSLFIESPNTPLVIKHTFCQFSFFTQPLKLEIRNEKRAYA